MKKRIIAITATLILMIASIFSLSSCTNLTSEDAFTIFQEAYNNTITNWSDIYFWQEDVRVKAYYDKEADKPVNGSLINTSVNVHCDYDNDDNYIKDQNYNASVNVTYYSETIDKTEKTMTNYLGKNDIYAVVNKNDVESLFVTKKVQTESKEEVTNYAQLNVDTHEFTASKWFEQYTLKSKLAVLGGLTVDDVTFVKSAEVNNDSGAQQVFMTTKMSFTVSDEYLNAHPEANILRGKYVYLEIVDVNLGSDSDYRISNLYVYNVETAGGLEVEYESYKLNISYMGPYINAINHEEVKGDKNVWEQRNDLFVDGMINSDCLFIPSL